MSCYGMVARVEPDTIAAQAGIERGDKLITVNGERISDIINLSFALAEENIYLEIEKVNGERQQIEIEKEYDEDLGIEFESAIFDKIKSCANRCLFCFVDQMPPHLRESLYVKDDDYRLSFLYGNFITLTNLSPADYQVIRNFHLSPLYISVHTTNDKLRSQMLANRKAGSIMTQLKNLLAANIELHTQVVLCPGINDGPILEQTIKDLFSLPPGILSLAIVPVGLSKFRDNCYPLTVFTPAAAGQVVEQVSKWQAVFREKTGNSFVYLADEFYLKAGQPFPADNYYDGFPQLENGIGLVRSFLTEWEQAGPINGSYEHPTTVDIVCGISAYPVLQSIFSRLAVANLTVRLVPIVNNFFGQNITVTGLLTGRDIIDQLAGGYSSASRIIVPGVALRKGETIFLDGITPADIADALGKPVEIAYGAADLHHLLQPRK